MGLTEREEHEKDADGVCKDCGEKTVGGDGYKCCYYAESCKTCGFATCDLSC